VRKALPRVFSTVCSLLFFLIHLVAMGSFFQQDGERVLTILQGFSELNLSSKFVQVDVKHALF